MIPEPSRAGIADYGRCPDQWSSRRANNLQPDTLAENFWAQIQKVKATAGSASRWGIPGTFSLYIQDSHLLAKRT